MGPRDIARHKEGSYHVIKRPTAARAATTKTEAIQPAETDVSAEYEFKIWTVTRQAGVSSQYVNKAR
jgi:hypothetical protein